MHDNIHRVKRVLRAYGGSQLLTSSKPKLDYLNLGLEIPLFNTYSTTFWNPTLNLGRGGIAFNDPNKDFFNRPLVFPKAPIVLTTENKVVDEEALLLAQLQLLEQLLKLQERMLTIRSIASGVTLAGMLTGNKTMANVGLIGSMSLSVADLLKAMKGTKGINKTAGSMGIAGTIADTAGDVLFSGAHDKDSSLTTGLNTGYDAISSSLMGFTPVGTIIGGAMKVGGFVGDALSSMGVGTDQMTTSDLILDSNFLKLTPMGLVNAIGAKKTLNFSTNTQTIELVGGSYGGSVKGINDAASKAGKKYGLFSSGSRKNANNQIDVARGLLNTMTGIANEASDMSSMASNMAQLNHMNYSFNLNGGYDLRYMRAAASGVKLDRIKKLNLSRFKTGGTIGSVNLNTKEIEWTPVITDPIEVYEDGGKFDWTPVITDIVPELYKGGLLDSLIARVNQSKANFVKRLNEPTIRTIPSKNGYVMSHKLGYADIDGKTIVFPQVQEIDGKLQYFEDWRKAVDSAILRKDTLEMTPDEAELFTTQYKTKYPGFKNTKFREGGKTKELDTPEIEETTLKNVIPEGALHARKHHMENAEGLTEKGIPVVDDDKEQLAEIELNEIIFTLEVTKKLEELLKDGSDSAAIEAGKLLVEQILFNTDDRTGLISTLELGGTIQAKNEQ